MILIGIFKGVPTALGFLIGATCSLLAGFIGMRVAVISNIRTAQAATIGANPALRAAFNGGAVTGLLVVGLALLSVGGFYLGADAYFSNATDPAAGHKKALDALMVSPWAAASSRSSPVSAAASTPKRPMLAPTSPARSSRTWTRMIRAIRRPSRTTSATTSAIAGMAADVFETYAVSLIGSVLVGALTYAAEPNAQAYIIFPFLICGLSVIASVLGIIFINVGNLKPTNALLAGVALSAIIAGLLFLPLSYGLFGDQWLSFYGPTLVGWR